MCFHKCDHLLFLQLATTSSHLAPRTSHLAPCTEFQVNPTDELNLDLDYSPSTQTLGSLGRCLPKLTNSVLLPLNSTNHALTSTFHHQLSQHLLYIPVKEVWHSGLALADSLDDEGRYSFWYPGTFTLLFSSAVSSCTLLFYRALHYSSSAPRSPLPLVSMFSAVSLFTD